MFKKRITARLKKYLLNNPYSSLCVEITAGQLYRREERKKGKGRGRDKGKEEERRKADWPALARGGQLGKEERAGGPAVGLDETRAVSPAGCELRCAEGVAMPPGTAGLSKGTVFRPNAVRQMAAFHSKQSRVCPF